MPSTIIVGFDGRDHASDALALGQLLARTTGDRLLVVCAYPEDPLGHGGAIADIGTSVRHDAEAAIEKARAQAGDGGGVTIEFHAIAGAKPSQVLHDLAEERDAAAIVVGATHHGAAVRLLTGSTPERVLDGSPCPVAVAPTGFAAANADHATSGTLGGSGGSSLQVAVAYDDSPEAVHALDAAAAFARRAGGRLRVVTAVNSAVGLYPPLDPTAYAEIADLARDAARERLDDAVAKLEGLTVDAAVVDGDPANVLLEDSEHDDLLFTGSGGKGPFRRVLLGSVSTTLLREAACPVVIVPRGSGEAAPS
ncbi:universal stress protein [Conexibacter stalactiti]|uniref:Universal stress protein n=1 Tax=Conexibacter stalactiti TaxID=1940611 RepID=A0ABU4HQW8_9ACTN|nr:universal stress protein [Conexibacter stalactiti]MDW5595676.1 universal stress protein [Conexibacter stalactiti]MEC5036318.1 universal stress protein [Conexibacter stalactiti]